MRIRCPFCGERDQAEFTYLGDASFRRPDPQASDAQTQFVAAVYLRDNPAGPHQELWYHARGCRSWLQVTRDTRTHEMQGTVELDSEVTCDTRTQQMLGTGGVSSNLSRS